MPNDPTNAIERFYARVLFYYVHNKGRQNLDNQTGFLIILDK